MQNELNVFLFGCKAGTIRRPDIKRPLKIFFSYDEAYSGSPLSLSLPVSQREFDEDRTYSFFDNLLPEEAVMQEFLKRRRIPSGDLLGCLAVLGKETAGAIVITEEDNVPVNDGKYRDITHIVETFSAEKQGFLAVESGARFSLAGAQDKLAAVVKDGHVFVPEGYSPTTHILKPDSLRFPQLIYNEAFCLDVAETIGLPTSKHGIVMFGEKPYLVLERYDRILKDTFIERMHQEDFCQVMGIFASAKYQQFKCYEGISDIAKTALNAGMDVGEFLVDFLFFNMIIGNNDAHAKNLSILYNKNGDISLAPMYDIVCTEVYPGLEDDMAMSIGRHFCRDELIASDFELLADDTNVSLENVCQRLAILSEIITQACVEVSKKTLYDDMKGLANSICTIVENHAAQAKNILEEFH